MLTSIVGINWGDEGKGRMVDLLSADYDVVCRYQGGNNAGHTVINPLGKFILNLLPSGILRETTINVMGGGMVIDIEHLNGEMGKLREGGVKISPANLKISHRAIICMPYHKQLDILEEERLKDAAFGSTRRGIAPVYSDKYMKKGITMGDLLHSDDELKKKLDGIVAWKNLTLRAYGAKDITVDEMFAWLRKFGDPLKEYICDTTRILSDANNTDKKIMFEAQLGALRDIDYGIYPYTSSSSTLAAYAPIGAGIPGSRLDEVIGITKAYSSCVGEGPFTCEFFGDEAEKLREAGGEYGAATGRPRRVGGFDVVASRFGVLVQGATCLALTKLDVLSGYEEIPVCTHYELDGKKIDFFPSGMDLAKAKPVYETLKGWNCDITKCRKESDLPKEAVDYIHFIEEQMGCTVKYVSVGAEREDYLIMNSAK